MTLRCAPHSTIDADFKSRPMSKACVWYIVRFVYEDTRFTQSVKCLKEDSCSLGEWLSDLKLGY